MLFLILLDLFEPRFKRAGKRMKGSMFAVDDEGAYRFAVNSADFHVMFLVSSGLTNQE